jgi:hypothetical protein
MSYIKISLLETQITVKTLMISGIHKITSFCDFKNNNNSLLFEYYVLFNIIL